MPRRMAFTGPYQVEILEYEEPQLQPGQVRIRTELASGKHGTTTGMFDGRTFAGQRFDQDMRLFVEAEGAAPPTASREHPWNAGTTGVGTVIEAASDVTGFDVGDHVFGLMDIRETNVVDQQWLWALDDIDPEQALCIEPAYVAFHAIRESQIRYGDSVVVIGLGVLGLLATRMAVQAGCEKVFAVDMLPNRRAWALRHGADDVFDPRENDVARRIHELTGGAGVDVAIELAGVTPALQTAIRCVRNTGTVCSAGFYQGEAKGLYLGREWHHNRLTIVVPHGCGWGHPPRDYPRWDQKRAYDALAGLLRTGKLDVPGLITPVVALEEGADVFRLIREEPDKVIKYAVRF
jgi:threonine dehydrogenase-like Zn-dependent dehydrogenase